MTLQLAFWLFMILLVLGAGWAWPGSPWPYRGSNLLLIVVLVILGWRVFGAPIHGG